MVHKIRVNFKDYDTKVGSVRYTPVNLGGRDSISSLLQSISGTVREFSAATFCANFEVLVRLPII